MNAAERGRDVLKRLAEKRPLHDDAPDMQGNTDFEHGAMQVVIENLCDELEAATTPEPVTTGQVWTRCENAPVDVLAAMDHEIACGAGRLIEARAAVAELVEAVTEALPDWQHLIEGAYNRDGSEADRLRAALARVGAA